MPDQKLKQNKTYQEKAKEASAWLASAEGEKKLKENLVAARKFTDFLTEKRQISIHKMKEVVTI